MIYVKMKSSRVGAAGHCRAGTVHSADANTPKGATLRAYVKSGAAEELSKKQAASALKQSVTLDAPVAKGEKSAVSKAQAQKATAQAKTKATKAVNAAQAKVDALGADDPGYDEAVAELDTAKEARAELDK